MVEAEDNMTALHRLSGWTLYMRLHSWKMRSFFTECCTSDEEPFSAWNVPCQPKSCTKLQGGNFTKLHVLLRVQVNVTLNYKPMTGGKHQFSVAGGLSFVGFTVLRGSDWSDYFIERMVDC